MKSYCIMHMERHVATLRGDGSCTIYYPSFMPYNLYLEQVADGDMDTRMSNITNFYFWCASRVLTLDRVFAKEILNSLGMKQAVTDRDRAEIAISYHCVCLTDVFWVRQGGERIAYRSINLYQHSLSDAFVDVSLFGKTLTAQNAEMLHKLDSAGDVATAGVAPKAWIRREEGFWLLKDGNPREVRAELLASRIAACFDVPQVAYIPMKFRGEEVSACRIMTSLEVGIVPAEYAEVYAANHDTTLMEIVARHDLYGYHMMNIVDYLVGNNDRHWGNWGFLVDNRTNRLGKMYPLMDFNRAFAAYDTVEGVRCQTTEGNRSQMQAALHGVARVGLNQIAEVRKEWFTDPAQYDMFAKRLALLKERSKG